MNNKTGNNANESYRERALNHLWVQTQQYNDLAAEDGLLFIAVSYTHLTLPTKA